MGGAFGAAIVTLMTGFGVYRSCVVHHRILAKALMIDAIGAVFCIGLFWAVGVFK